MKNTKLIINPCQSDYDVKFVINIDEQQISFINNTIKEKPISLDFELYSSDEVRVQLIEVKDDLELYIIYSTILNF